MKEHLMKIFFNFYEHKLLQIHQWRQWLFNFLALFNFVGLLMLLLKTSSKLCPLPI